MLALIDGDIITYRVGWTTENDNEGIARARTDEMLDGILLDTGATEFTIWLSDRAENNFRYKIYPKYKANRKTLPRPRHLDFLKEYLIVHWGARIALEMEADDALGIEQMRWFGFLKAGEVGDTLTTICTIDKDLQQIPGNHYNFVKKEHSFVTPEQGLKTFYKQILIGDVADNISGCPGIGPIRAEKIIGPLRADVGTLAKAVLNTFLTKGKVHQNEDCAEEETIAYIEAIGQVLKVKQTEGEKLWRFPQESLMQESQLSSLLKKPEEVGPSLEPITQEKNGVQ